MRSQSSRPNLNLATWPVGLENGEYYTFLANMFVMASSVGIGGEFAQRELKLMPGVRLLN